MQSLDIISVNIWQILISLLNLLILFLLLKKFLYKPVKKAMLKRKQEIDSQYDKAQSAKDDAEKDKLLWQQKLESANSEAENLIKNASFNADKHTEKVLADAKDRADAIIRQAKSEAELEKKKATADIKKEIIEVSSELAQKMLSREINTDDHKELIDSFLDGIGDGDV